MIVIMAKSPHFILTESSISEGIIFFGLPLACLTFSLSILSRAPIVVGRRVNLKTEVLPVSVSRLSSTFKEKNHNTCFYGQCYYCKETELACGKVIMLVDQRVYRYLSWWSWSFQVLRHSHAFLGRNNGRISNIMDARPVETRKSAASLSENI